LAPGLRRTPRSSPPQPYTLNPRPSRMAAHTSIVSPSRGFHRCHSTGVICAGRVRRRGMSIQHVSSSPRYLRTATSISGQSVKRGEPKAGPLESEGTEDERGGGREKRAREMRTYLTRYFCFLASMSMTAHENSGISQKGSSWPVLPSSGGCKTKKPRQNLVGSWVLRIIVDWGGDAHGLRGKMHGHAAR
jgi:hypothetical protein